MTLNILGRIYLTSYSTECRGAYGEDLENRVHLLYSVAFIRVSAFIFNIFQFLPLCLFREYLRQGWTKLTNLQIWWWIISLQCHDSPPNDKMSRCGVVVWAIRDIPTHNSSRPIVISPIVAAPSSTNPIRGQQKFNKLDVQIHWMSFWPIKECFNMRPVSFQRSTPGHDFIF